MRSEPVYLAKLFLIISVIFSAGALLGVTVYLSYNEPADIQRNQISVKPEPTITSLPALTELQIPADTAGWQTYRSQKYGFRMKYPNNWIVRVENSQVKFISLENDEKAAEKDKKFIDVTVSNNYKKYSLEDWFEDYKNDSVNTNGVSLTFEKEILVNGEKGLLGGFGCCMSYRQSFFAAKGDNIYGISGGYMDFDAKPYGSKYAYSDDFIKILSTFEFIKPEEYNGIFAKILPPDYDSSATAYFIDDLNNDGMDEMAITSALSGSEQGYYTNAYIAVVTNFDENGNYEKVGDIGLNPKNIDPMSAAPKVSYIQDIDNDGGKEMIVSLGMGGAYTAASGIFKIDWKLGKINWLKFKDEKGVIRNTSFLVGASVMNKAGFSLEDVDDDGKMEIVREEGSYIGTDGEDLENRENWKNQAWVYKWNGSIFVYSKDLSVSATKTVGWQLYRNEEYGYEFKYPGSDADGLLTVSDEKSDVENRCLEFGDGIEEKKVRINGIDFTVIGSFGGGMSHVEGIECYAAFRNGKYYTFGFNERYVSDCGVYDEGSPEYTRCKNGDELKEIDKHNKEILSTFRFLR